MNMFSLIIKNSIYNFIKYINLYIYIYIYINILYYDMHVYPII